MDDQAAFRAAIEARDQEIAQLRAKVNRLHSQIAARDMFVRWFATEYGLETYGRRGDELKPETPAAALGRCTGWFRKLLGK